MAQRIVQKSSTITSTSSFLKYSLQYKHNHKKAFFGTSTIQWFHRFLSPKEEKQLYKGITTLFRERLDEKSTSSKQSYKNIIDQIILGTTTTTSEPTATTTIPYTLTLSQLDQFKKDIDNAGKLKDGQQLNKIWSDMKKLGQQIPITMYNRLLRAFLLSYDDIDEEKGLMKAKEIVQVIHDQHRLPTTRTYTYMIQAYLKRNDLDQAKHYVTLLHRYSLDKFKTSFDCSIMMRYYIQSGDTYAKDFLWRDIQRHADMIQPGPNLFTIYVESLLSASYLSHEMIADVARSFVHHFYQSITASTATFKENNINNNNIHFTQHQLSTWLKVVRLLTHSENNKENEFYCTDAESLLLCLIQLTNNHHQLQINNNNDPFLLSSSVKKQGIMAVQEIFHIYLQKAQDVKVLAFYYKLRKSGVKEDVFGKELTNTIGSVLKRIEVKQQQQKQQDNDDHYNHKALLEEFGLNLKPT